MDVLDKRHTIPSVIEELECLEAILDKFEELAPTKDDSDLSKLIAKFVDGKNKIAIRIRNQAEYNAVASILLDKRALWASGTMVEPNDIVSEDMLSKYKDRGYIELYSHPEGRMRYCDSDDYYEWNELVDLDFLGLFTEMTDEREELIDDFISGKVALHCTTEKDADTLMEILSERGIKWRDGDDVIGNSRWNDYEDDTCYSVEDGVLCYDNYSCYEEDDCRIRCFD